MADNSGTTQQYLPMAPLQRYTDRRVLITGGGIFAKPDAVAAVVAMLASSDAYFVTGTEVRVDGGTHM